MTDYYAILEVLPNASQTDIKAAFKRLAVKYHPDKHQGNTEMEERFKDVNQAYQVLSNPYEKARYDLQIQFGETHQTFTYQAPAPYSGARRPRYKQPEVKWRENWIATAYALGFTVVVASLVMTVIFVKNYFDSKRVEEMLANRRVLFEQAQLSYENGKVEQAMVFLNELGMFFESEQDMESYKKELLDGFIFQAEHSYNLQSYQQAVYYYELLEAFAPRTPLQLKEHLAKSYIELEEIEKGIYYLKQLLLADYSKLEIYLLLGQISRDKQGDIQEAQRYFELASEVAISQYRAIYGEAYLVVMGGTSLPPYHYWLYTGLAETYFQTGNYEKAIKATIWNVAMWPDSASNYAVAARSYLELGQTKQACVAYSSALNLGYTESLEISCN